MLYDNQEVLAYLKNQRGKLVHLYGKPDAGRTQSVFSILDHVGQEDRLCGYWVPRKEDFRQNVFREMIAWPERYLIGFPKTVKELSLFLPLAAGTDLVCIDNFLEYIIHKPKDQIRAVLTLLSATAYQHGTNFLLVNDLRYYESKGGMHPAYQEYFRHFCARHVEVEKDSDFHIRYAFKEL